VAVAVEAITAVEPVLLVAVVPQEVEVRLLTVLHKTVPTTLVVAVLVVAMTEAVLAVRVSLLFATLQLVQLLLEQDSLEQQQQWGLTK
jgi:hypothetical protein